MLAVTCARAAAGRSVRAAVSASSVLPSYLDSGVTVRHHASPLILESASTHAVRTGVPPMRPITIDSITEREMELRNEPELGADLVDLSMFEEGLAFDLFGPDDDSRSKKAWSKPEKPLVKSGKREKNSKRAKFEAMSEQIVHEGVSQGVGLAVRSARASRRSLRKLVRRVTDSAMLGEDFEMALEPLYLQNEQQPRPRPRRQ